MNADALVDIDANVDVVRSGDVTGSSVDIDATTGAIAGVFGVTANGGVIAPTAVGAVQATDVTASFGPIQLISTNSGVTVDNVTGDSISMEARDVRGAGGVTQIRWYGAIARGPHAGKAPSPWVVGANGFFEVTPYSARGSGGSIVANRYFVDFDDTYFRGGDVLLYFWTATDAGGGRGSFPYRISPPAATAPTVESHPPSDGQRPSANSSRSRCRGEQAAR